MKNALKAVLMRIPGALPLARFILFQLKNVRSKGNSAEEVFNNIYRRNAWGGAGSLSGPGSSLEQTRVIAGELPRILEELEISSLLDIPSGDFHWMRTVDLDGIQYIGADIVPELVESNRRYENDGMKFTRLDLTNDSLPKADLVLVRDCFVHLSNEDVFKSLVNICSSGSTYLLTTTFSEASTNIDIATGEWRPLNLQNPPFDFPEPLMVINENCTENEGRYSDKCLALWRIADIETGLPDRCTWQPAVPHGLIRQERNMTPQLSVLFTTFNDSRFIAEALQSILNQSFTDFELLIVDDASSDGTLDIVSQYDDPRIRILRNESNFGLVKSLNAALPHCRAELVARQDGDDVSLPTRLEMQVKFMQEHPDVALLGTQDIWIDENGSETDRFSFPTDHEQIVQCLRERNCFNHSSVIFRKSIVESSGRYRLLPGCEDYDLWARIAARHRVANLPDRLVLRRIRRGSMLVEGIAQQSSSNSLVSRLAKQRFDTGRDELDGLTAKETEKRIAALIRRELKYNKRLRASSNVELFHRVLESNGRWAALRYLVRAMRLDPFDRGIMRRLLDNYVSRRVWPLLKTIKGRF